MAYWVFQAPAGYKYERVSGRGKMIVRDEPLASVIQEALEGYASGRFDSQADVQRFMKNNPLFPKDKRGEVRHQRVSLLLNQAGYAGYVEAPNWGVDLRVGQHEPIISSPDLPAHPRTPQGRLLRAASIRFERGLPAARSCRL